MNIIIKKSDKNDKQIMALIDNANTNKKIHFGAKLYEDYTLHKDDKRKKSYLSRHRYDNYTNVNYPSFYATNLLWNKKTLKESITATNEKINVNIKLIS